MIDYARRIEAFVRFGQELEKLYKDDLSGKKEDVFRRAQAENQWFTAESIDTALKNWVITLKPDDIRKWGNKYIDSMRKDKQAINVGVINAGNIPFVGLHDLLSVILSGNNYYGKNATGDTILLPYVASLLCEIEPEFSEHIHFISKLEKPDAVIATGSNNTSRYFEYYFEKYPHVIRKNRNGIAVLYGDETSEQLHSLGNDIFLYFGLGCRNVSKLYVPRGYDFKFFFESIEEYNTIGMHNKYMNNFDYNNSILILKRIHFLQNGFLIVRNEKQIASPVSVLHFEEYDSAKQLEKQLLEHIDDLQCIVSKDKFSAGNLEAVRVEFGKTQSPQLWDYADGVDTLRFLTQI